MSTVSWFSRALLPWYRENRRSLPWRGIRDPYRIWLSEVILQQTRVDQGLAYWERFVKRYPKVADLAAASEHDVLKLWQGLGYYSRARNLLTAARQVVKEHGGAFPRTYPELKGLKGVGEYTAAAIGSIAFDLPEPVVDGNVYRVLARIFGIATPIDSTTGRKEFRELAARLVDKQNPGDHNQAVMELGATICTPRNPACGECPLASKCIARKTDRISELPVKAGRTKVRERHFNYLHIEDARGLYFQRRNGKDIWQGLYEPPLIESRKALTPKPLTEVLGKGEWKVLSRSKEVKHVLSHQVIRAVFWKVVPPKGFRADPAWERVHAKKVRELAVPRLIDRWLETL